MLKIFKKIYSLANFLGLPWLIGSYFLLYRILEEVGLKSIDSQLIYLLIGLLWFVIVINNLKFLSKKKSYGLFTWLEPVEYAEEETTAWRKAAYPEIPANLLSSKPKDFVIGRKGQNYIYMPVKSDGLNCIITAEPGSGKSVMLLGWILSLIKRAQIHSKRELKKIKPWNFFLIDVDGLLYRKILKIEKYDAELDGDKGTYVVELNNRLSNGFDVFYRFKKEGVTTTDKLKVATDISDALIEESGDNPYFSGNAKKILKGVLLWGINKGMEFIDIIHCITREKMDDLLKRIVEEAEADGEEIILDQLKSFVGKEGNESLQDVETTLKQNLSVFGYPDIEYALNSNPNMVDPSVLNDGTSNLVFACPTAMLSTYQPVFRLITMLVLRHCESEFREDDNRNTSILIDEAARIGKVEDLPDLMATGRKFHVNIFLFFQDLAQFRYIYKKELAEIIINLCEAKIFISGAGDKSTTEWISGIAGQYRTEKQNYQKKTLGKSDIKYADDMRDIVNAKNISSLKEKGEMILIYFGRYYRFKKFKYYEDRYLK